MSDNVISLYTRRQAISDSVLIPVDDLAREAGFTWTVAVTDHLYHGYIVPSLALMSEGQSISGRLWDVLQVLRHAIRSSKDDTYLRFSVLFLMSPGAAPVPVELVSVAGPDDDGSPCLTIMLPEDY
ncbi:MAG: DUF6573 family protein [Bacillota bacterium]|jgi:hypothetical protein